MCILIRQMQPRLSFVYLLFFLSATGSSFNTIFTKIKNTAISMSHKNKVTQDEDELKSILFIQSCSVHNDVKVSEIA